VVRMQIAERLGADAGSLVMADGSGLSRENRVTARLLATWMAMIARLPDGAGQAYVDSMAVPGEGSWSNRFRDLTKLQSDFHGKSGFINNVLSLSGFVTHAPSGRRVVVSILVNRTNEAPPGKVREFQESVVEQLDRFLARSSGARPAVGG
jgi:D-alanyl-D-alanine carboxypeptidase/D-alanyl-D-alanine-endopeptidase (penicillin-binding protein 4)